VGYTHRRFLVNSNETTTSKVSRVLNVIVFCMIAILVRVWYLAVVQHEKHVEEAHKPQRRTSIEHMGRASIRDRFNIPLALNKVQFHAAVCYSHLRQIPSVRWETDSSGKRVRVQARTRHIKELSEKMAEILHLDPLYIEDVIHAKASLIPHAPFLVKENISEGEYYRLRALEKDWPGLAVQRSSRRLYTHGKVACDVLGSMGAISSHEYQKFTEELSELEEYVNKREAGETPFLPKGFQNPYAVRQRLLELQEKAYTIQDFIGRTGIEAAFDEELRGYSGRKMYEVDVKGNFLRELPGSRPALPGQRLLLTISSELQECAEQLLSQSEATRIKRAGGLEEPWIKGGAIVAMEPSTGEILALASYPRFDPNDFISIRSALDDTHQRSKVRKWLENEMHIGEIWDGKIPLEREFYEKEANFYNESMPLTWNIFLETIFPAGAVREVLSTKLTLRHAVDLQRSLMTLMRHSGQYKAEAILRCLSDPDLAKEDPQLHSCLMQKELLESRRSVEHLTNGASEIGDKLLLIDLCRLVASPEKMPPSLLESMGSMTLEQHFLQRQAFLCLEEVVHKKVEELFIAHEFAEWRAKHFKVLLKKKRKEEKEEKRYAKPYTDYLDQVEKKAFSEFWHEFRLPLIHALLRKTPLERIIGFEHAKAYFEEIQPLYEKLSSTHQSLEKLSQTVRYLSDSQGQLFLRSLRGFRELNRPLWGRYPRLRNEQGIQLERHLAAAFYPVEGFGYGRSQAFRQSTPAGSVFKIVIAYHALLEKYEQCLAMQESMRDLNPLVLTDYSPQRRKKNDHDTIFGKTSDGKPITRLYKGGRLPRSSHAGIGEVNILGALEQSSNIYFSILAAEEISSPERLLQTVRQFGYGEKTGIELPGEIEGHLPDDIGHDKSGLYSFAIGQHSLIVTPLQTAMMIGAFTGNGQLLHPSIVQIKAGKQRLVEEEELFYRTDFVYHDEFAAVGLNFPLFTALAEYSPQLAFSYAPVQVRRSIFLPPEIRDILMEGMRRVVSGPRGTSRPSVVRPICFTPAIAQDYLTFSRNIAGKTGTAEILYKPTIDRTTKAIMRKHTWFAGACYPQKANNGGVDWDNPELLVVVYLRFADAGREAAPLAVQVMKKWRELLVKHGASSHVQIPN